MPREACAGCGKTPLIPILDLGRSPLADRFPTSPLEEETFYPLQVVVCRACWLVQLLEVVPDDELFGSDYAFRSGTSPSLVAYLREYAGWLQARFHDRMAAHGLVEIACNDGTLLGELRGYPSLGIDPAAGAIADAKAKGLNVLQAPFTRQLAEELRSSWGRPGVIVANNVAAHVADPNDFLAGLALLLADDGVAVLEVQSLADLIAGNQFDHVYHEHRSYLSVHAVQTLAKPHGLHVLAAQHTPAQGGSLRLVLGRHDRTSQSVTLHLRAEARLGLRDLAALQQLQGRAVYLRYRLLRLLEAQDGMVAGYAATAKSTTLLNWCGIGTGYLAYVEDTTPGKIGRVTPGTHIPIVAPGTRPRPATYLLLAWNYLAGVLHREREYLDAGGRFLVPIPTPVIL